MWNHSGHLHLLSIIRVRVTPRHSQLNCPFVQVAVRRAEREEQNEEKCNKDNTRSRITFLHVL